jgi:cytochrome oxidase Cu insertion factor (SCO1/SenC/PrrC family)
MVGRIAEVVVAEQPVARAPRSKVRTLTTWAILASLLIPVAIVGYYVLFVTAGTTSVDPAMEQLARDNAGTAVAAFTGPDHTVYHSTAPLPSEAAPRGDGRPTLVWFSATNCPDCKRMESFAHQAAHQFIARAAFVEKAVDRDSAAARYGVTSTPTFILIDARGRELSRFGYQPSAAAFSQAIEAALQPR